MNHSYTTVFLGIIIAYSTTVVWTAIIKKYKLKIAESLTQYTVYALPKIFLTIVYWYHHRNLWFFHLSIIFRNY